MILSLKLYCMYSVPFKCYFCHLYTGIWQIWWITLSSLEMWLWQDIYTLERCGKNYIFHQFTEKNNVDTCLNSYMYSFGSILHLYTFFLSYLLMTTFDDLFLRNHGILHSFLVFLIGYSIMHGSFAWPMQNYFSCVELNNG